ncbi:DUF4176 domain-containing protein [Lactococcus lactis subsp. lactis]|uniref:DUF4176 domain-containing protein n=1 Tax=Lactococcus lactis TaxID=1358 RepID=UPI00223B2C36|nr:DUF4176 domain-containing protein [Lactococcus lactis]MCT0017804.1 DUF4176 domain-containing protein [Lactococcus lactis subsp. lactis]
MERFITAKRKFDKQFKHNAVKLMIFGRGASFDNGEGQTFSDYVGVVYPNGIDPQDALFFQIKMRM